jgi:hypothetical protein
MPYDQFARELLGSRGSTLENAAAFYRTATDTNDCVGISRVFLGSRLQCAKCHNHPFERWTQDNYYGMAAFFTRVQRKKSLRPDEFFIYSAKAGEVTQPRTQKQMKPWLPLKGEVDPPADTDRRDTFTGWLTQKENPFFGKIEANRIWSQLFGRGIALEPNDDFYRVEPSQRRSARRPLKDFAEHKFDRHLLDHSEQPHLPGGLPPQRFPARTTSSTAPLPAPADERGATFDAICARHRAPEQFAGLPARTRRPNSRPDRSSTSS